MNTTEDVPPLTIMKDEDKLLQIIEINRENFNNVAWINEMSTKNENTPHAKLNRILNLCEIYYSALVLNYDIEYIS